MVPSKAAGMRVQSVSGVIDLGCQLREGVLNREVTAVHGADRTPPLGPTAQLRVIHQELTFQPSFFNQFLVGAFRKTRRERLKSALYLRLKKRKTFFWKKT